LHRDLAAKLDTLINEVLAAQGIRAHSVNARVKERGEVERKLQRNPDAFTDLCDMTDVVGVRIITYFTDQVEEVAKIVEDEFDIDQAKSTDKGADLEPDRFGYLSLHYIARLAAGRAEWAEYRRFAGCVFEIQIRSILQHAWAEIEHDLGYKSEASVPRHIRRRFSQLAGLLEIADERFLEIRRESEAYGAEVKRRLRHDPGSVFIDKESMAEFIRTSSRVRQLDDAIAASSRMRMADAHLTEYVSDVLSRNSQAAGFRTLAEIQSWLDRYGEVIVGYARRWYTKSDTVLRGASLFYVCFVRVARTRDRDRIEKYLRESAIGADLGDLAVRILTTFDQVAAEMPIPDPP
jgi:ppGpp synthetase/RelA/SpoT-type nucleotidyltranferase